jgi:hypothetical protein
MATEDREVMEAQGAGESCPTFSKLVPGDSMSEGKPRASLVRKMPHLTAIGISSGGEEHTKDTW